MNKFLVVTALCLAIVLPTGINAKTKQSIYKDCGIGAMIFSGETNMDRSLASLVNVIWDWGTTASSSKSSGTCERDGKEVAAAIFINQTYESVLEDTAKGQGEHLSALLDLLNVEELTRGQLISSLQAKVADAVNVDGYDNQTRLEKSEAYFNILDTLI